MAACMESQSNASSAQSRPRDGRGVSDVCDVNLSPESTHITENCVKYSIVN